MKHNLYIMVGCPGSGKSTWLEQNANGRVISRDKIRFAILRPGEDYFAREKEVYGIMINAIRNSLETEINTYVDATHLNRYSRNKLFSSIGMGYLQNANIIAVYFDTPLSVCMNRNGKRDDRTKVPNNEVRKMYQKLSKPDSFTESLINEIIIIKYEEE